MDVDVLVVGAGPTGLMLANQLARRGVRTLILDKNAGPARETRALGVQARTLEIYAHLGIAEEAVALGRPGVGAHMWSRGRKAAWVPFNDIGRGSTKYPFILILGQDDNERLLGELLRRKGGAIEWSTELVGLTQEEDRVVAKLKQADGKTREVTAAWAAGCDGGHSTVRELTGIEFQGAPYEHVFYVADTQMTGPMVQDELNIYLWPGGFHLFFPLRGPDHWRIVGILPPSLRGRDDLTLDELFPSIRAEAGTALALQGCSWFSTYRIHHRRAARFRDRRCFLLGDAAHVHSPVGAQGMNTGLQDAYNLAWKLALVASGAADQALLDSYGAEREPVAERLLSTTDRMFSFIVSGRKIVGVMRTRLLPKLLAFAMLFKKLQHFFFRTVSQLGIRYRGSVLSEALPGLPEGGPSAGDRFPWLHLKLASDSPVEDIYGKIDDTRFTLILIGQPPLDEKSGLGDLLGILTVPADPSNEKELAEARIPNRAFYLLRPDGYIGLCGTQLAPGVVARYLSERVRLKASSAR